MSTSKTKTKTQSTPSTATAASAPSNGRDPFADYQDADDFQQPEGYWAPDAGPLHGVLLTAWKSIAKSGRSKGQVRVTYLFRLLSPTPASVGEGGEREVETLQPGALCAVFDSADLRELRNLEGCACLVKRGKLNKRTGKVEMVKALDNGNELKLFTVRFKGTKKALDIRELFQRRDEGEGGDAASDDDYEDAF